MSAESSTFGMLDRKYPLEIDFERIHGGQKNGHKLSTAKSDDGEGVGQGMAASRPGSISGPGCRENMGCIKCARDIFYDLYFLFL